MGGIQKKAMIRGFFIELETSRLEMNGLETSPLYVFIRWFPVYPQPAFFYDGAMLKECRK